MSTRPIITLVSTCSKDEWADTSNGIVPNKISDWTFWGKHGTSWTSHLSFDQSCTSSLIGEMNVVCKETRTVEPFHSLLESMIWVEELEDCDGKQVTTTTQEQARGSCRDPCVTMWPSCNAKDAARYRIGWRADLYPCTAGRWSTLTFERSTLTYDL